MRHIVDEPHAAKPDRSEAAAIDILAHNRRRTHVREARRAASSGRRSLDQRAMECWRLRPSVPAAAGCAN
jgi:hypothetical protein